MSTKIISFEADHARRRIIHDTLADNVPEVARANQLINKANDLFRKWVLACGGRVIEIGVSDEGRVEVPFDRLGELQKIVDQYSEALDSSVSVGVGDRLSQSAKALIAAKLRGGNKIVTYDQSVEETINQEEERHKQSLHHQEPTNRLLKNFAPFKNHPMAPGMQTEEHSEAQVARAIAAEGDDLEGKKHPLEDEFHSVAQQHEEQLKQQALDNSEEQQKVKASVAQVLLKLRTQLPVIAKLKEVAPDAYNSINALASSVVLMARTLDSKPQQLAKASFDDIRPSKQEGESYDYSHVLPQKLQGEYKLIVSHDPDSNALNANLHYSGNIPEEAGPTPSWHKDDPAQVGRVCGYIFHGKDNSSFVEPHSYIERPHTNKGLGGAMYEALYAHAKNHHHVTKVSGGVHSPQSHSVHRKLARKYNMNIIGGREFVNDDGEDPVDVGDYSYMLKDEMNPQQGTERVLLDEPHFFTDIVRKSEKGNTLGKAEGGKRTNSYGHSYLQDESIKKHEWHDDIADHLNIHNTGYTSKEHIEKDSIPLTPEHAADKNIFDANHNDTSTIKSDDALLAYGVNWKVIHQIGNDKYMVKPYSNGEGLSQRVFHAAGLAHLHQKSFVTNYSDGGYNPAIVIKINPGYKTLEAHRELKFSDGKDIPGSQETRRNFQKIKLLDLALGAKDRHEGNIMLHKETGAPLAIDNDGIGRDYTTALTTKGETPEKFLRRASRHVYPDGSQELQDHDIKHVTHEWWPTVRDRVLEASQGHPWSNEIAKNIEAINSHIDNANNAEPQLNEGKMPHIFFHKEEEEKIAKADNIGKLVAQSRKKYAKPPEIQPGSLPYSSNPTPTSKNSSLFDYTNILPKKLTDKGYSLKIENRDGNREWNVGLLYRKRQVGEVRGYLRSMVSSLSDGQRIRGVEPHSHLEREHRGQGLGQKMYEALFAHVRGNHGVTHVRGGVHSKAAEQVHRSLARKHGFDIVGSDYDSTKENYPYGDYEYGLGEEPKQYTGRREKPRPKGFSMKNKHGQLHNTKLNRFQHSSPASVSYHPNGKPYEVKYAINGVPYRADGRGPSTLRFHDDGSVAAKIHTDVNGKVIDSTDYYQNGQVYIKQTPLETTEYYQDGQVRKKQTPLETTKYTSEGHVEHYTKLDSNGSIVSEKKYAHHEGEPPHLYHSIDVKDGVMTTMRDRGALGKSVQVVHPDGSKTHTIYNKDENGRNVTSTNKYNKYGRLVLSETRKPHLTHRETRQDDGPRKIEEFYENQDPYNPANWSSSPKSISYYGVSLRGDIAPVNPDKDTPAFTSFWRNGKTHTIQHRNNGILHHDTKPAKQVFDQDGNETTRHYYINGEAPAILPLDDTRHPDHPIHKEVKKSEGDSEPTQQPQLQPVPNKNLVVFHNTRESHLHYFDDTHGGSIPGPSIAIAHKNRQIGAFGDITLIAHPKLIDPQNPGVHVFNQDAYTPRDTGGHKWFGGDAGKLSEYGLTHNSVNIPPSHIFKIGLSHPDAHPGNPGWSAHWQGHTVNQFYKENPKLKNRDKKHVYHFSKWLSDKYRDAGFTRRSKNPDDVLRRMKPEELIGGEEGMGGEDDGLHTVKRLRSLDEVKKYGERTSVYYSGEKWHSAQYKTPGGYDYKEINEAIKRINHDGWSVKDATSRIGERTVRGTWTPEEIEHLENYVEARANFDANRPANYLEAKILRPVHLSEFHTAVVPHTMSPAHIAHLKKKYGLNVVKYPEEDKEKRHKAIMDAVNTHDLLLSEKPNFGDIKDSSLSDKQKEDQLYEIKQNDAPPRKLFNYSHLLPTSLADKYELTIVDSPHVTEHTDGSEYDKPAFKAFVHPRGKSFNRNSGQVEAYLRESRFPQGMVDTIEPHSYLEENMRGKGVGKAMYEALFAHAKNQRKINAISGGLHSVAANRLHRSLAQKYGFEIQGGGLDEEAYSGKEPYPHSGYSYTIKDEIPADDSDIDEGKLNHVCFITNNKPMAKSLKNVKPAPGSTADYTHLLSPDLGKGHTLKVHTQINPATDDKYLEAVFSVKNSRSKFPHGKVTGYIVGKHETAIEPHSHLSRPYQGKGIGKAMYEALYAHAMNNHGIKRVEGGMHTSAAEMVHRSLAKKYGMTIVGSDKMTENQSKRASENAGVTYTNYDYHYTLKAELSSDDGINETKLNPLKFYKD